MNKVKTLIGLILISTIAVTYAVPAMATKKEELPQTGLIWDTWDSYMESMDETTLYALATQRPGDVDADGKISASDARLCLRAAAKLDVLTEPQQKAADVDGNIVLTGSDARAILRAAANIEQLDDATIETTSDWGFVIGSLKTIGSGRYFWHCSIDKDGLRMNEYTVDNAPDGVDGAPIEQFFVFTPETSGSFTVTFKLADSNQNEIIDEYKISVVVTEETTI